MLARNEENILRTSVGHLLNNVNVDQIIIADNGSTDNTRAIAQQLSKVDQRVEWTDVSGPYQQSAITTGLAQDARQKGSDWILPNDADEFFCFGPHKIHDLCASKSVGAYRINICNFVQWRWVKRDHPRSIETMVFAARPIPSRETARYRVESRQIAYLQAPYLPKVLLRATPSLVIHMGNHWAGGVDGESVDLVRGEVLHAPMRSRQSVFDRAEQGRRVADLGLPDNYGWHVRRLSHLEPHELEEEWCVNSTICGLIGPRYHKKWLQFDTRLRRISQSQNLLSAPKC